MSQENEEAARRHRLDAIHDLSTTPSLKASPDTVPTAPLTDAPAGPANVVLSRPRRRTSLLVRGGLALLALCVVAGGVVGGVLLHGRSSPALKPVPDPFSVLFNGSALGCPQTAAWSPNGQQVAVLGYTTCGAPDESIVATNGAYSYLPATGGTLLLYDATTWHLDATVALDATAKALVPQQIRSDPSAMRFVAFNYSTPVWSPNGRQLAIPVGTGSGAGPSDAATYGEGLLLVTEASYGIKLLSQPATPPLTSLISSFASLPIMNWNLNAGTGTSGSLPQALAYRWNANGALVPSIPLPANNSAPAQQMPQGAVGNPDGGAEFSLWQNGSLFFTQACTPMKDPYTPPTICCPVTSYLNGAFWAGAAWSPDGKHLVIPDGGGGIGALGKVAAPASTPAVPPSPGCPLPGQVAGTGLAHLPIRDAAMAQVLKTLVPLFVVSQQDLTSTETYASGAQFTWSPDGKRVLVSEEYTESGQVSAPVLNIYDTASGKLSATFSAPRLIALAHIPPNALNEGQSVNFDEALWSPNGKRLLLMDPNAHVLLLLGPKTLQG